MNTPSSTPSLPGLGVTLIISGVFAVPVVLWGNRWPWLVALPIAIMVILTVRSEWLRIRVSNEPSRVQVMETTFVLEAPFESMRWRIREERWVPTAPPDSGEISNVAAVDTRPAVDEKLIAFA